MNSVSFHEKACRCQAVNRFFSSFHRYSPLPTNGRHNDPRPPRLGSFSSITEITHCRPAGGTLFVRPSRYYPPSPDSPCFHSHSVRRSTPGASWDPSFIVGCCHLQLELNRLSFDRLFVPPTFAVTRTRRLASVAILD